MARSYVLLLSVVIAVLQGCGSDNSEEIASLQKQVAVLTRQVEEIRKQIGTMQGTEQKLQKSLENLETEVDQLKTREVPPSTPPVKPGEGTAARSAPTAQQRSPAKVSCSQVWRQLGQGKSIAAVAQALGTTVEAVRACDQEVGRGGARR